MAVKTLTIDGKLVSAREGQTVLSGRARPGSTIPTLCHLDGLTDVGACRLCLVEVSDQRASSRPASPRSSKTWRFRPTPIGSATTGG